MAQHRLALGALGSRSPRTLVGRAFFIQSGRGRVSVGPSDGGRPFEVAARGGVEGFSEQSKRRLANYLSDCYASYIHFGTLTVADDILDKIKFKRALDRYLKSMLRRMRLEARDQMLEERLESICWFLEFQRRGAPHVHLLYSRYVPWSKLAGDWSDAISQPWAFHTSTKFEVLRGGRQQSISYVLKYAVKADQKDLPEKHKAEGFGRWWGVRGLRSTQAATYRLEITADRCSQQVSALIQLQEALSAGTAAGDCRELPWKHGDGATYINSKPQLDPYLAPTRWRESAEIQCSKLVLLGAQVIRDPVELGE